jgi:hypothetical protein
MKIYVRNIANSPHMVFIIAWSFCILLYSLHDSDLMPALSIDLFFFLLCFLVLFGLTSFFLYKINFTTRFTTPAYINYKLLLIANSIIFLPNFIYGGVPALTGVRDESFGIPMVMDIAMSLNGFTCVCCYYMFLTTRKKKQLLYCLYCLILYALIISRGFIAITVVTMFFLWLNVKRPGLTLFKISIIITSILFALYLFGVAGNIRTQTALATVSNPDDPADAGVEYSNEPIFEIGDPQGAFKDKIPGEFFWSYLYIASPLANLQYNIDITSRSITPNNFLTVVMNETMFDFIAKRYNESVKGYQRKTPELLISALTVCTTLAGSYATAGWWGMFYVMMIYWIFPVVYILMTAKNPLAIIGISTLSTIYLFSAFDNMFILSGLSLQIFYPIALNWFQNINFNKDKNPVLIQAENGAQN